MGWMHDDEVLRGLMMTTATDHDPISACCAGNTHGARCVGCVYEGCRCACHVQWPEVVYEDILDADEVMP